ncbi:hypothetical protein DAI22_02g086101 [Oryza sativa Japonica Group]|nr:hypothetical protein DAI22_02g086101 [Oryza sativa Japonica Group]
MESGIRPERLFFAKLRTSKFVRFPMVCGMLPLNILSSIYRIVRLLRLPISAGIVPESLFCLSHNQSSCGARLPTELGKLPLRPFPSKSNFFSWVQFARDERKLQSPASRWLYARSRYLKFGNNPKDGTTPVSPVATR